MKQIARRRKIDPLGRIVLPHEGQIALGFDQKTPIDIFLDDNEERLILQKSTPSCICCGAVSELKSLPHRKYLCERCLLAAVQTD